MRVVPPVQQAPGTRDCGIGDHRSDHVGCGCQCALQDGSAALRRGSRRPGHDHRFPPSRAADGTRRVLAVPVPTGQLDLPLPEPLAVRGQEMT